MEQQSQPIQQSSEMPESPNQGNQQSNDVDIDSIVQQISQERQRSNPDLQEGATEDPNRQTNKLSEFQRLAELEREHYRQRKLQKEQQSQHDYERQQWEQERAQYDQQLMRNKPSKWLEQKGMSVKDLADSIMQEQEDDGTEEGDKISYQEALEQAMGQLEGRFEEMYEQKRAEEADQYETQEAYENYQHEINNFLNEHIEHFPALVGFGGQNHVMGMIENEYNEIEDQYGEEYADKWLQRVNFGDYAQEVQKNIEQGLVNALQLPELRSYVEQILQQTGQADRNIEPRENAPRTLTKNNFASPSGRYQPEEMTEQERIQAAINLVKGQ